MASMRYLWISGGVFVVGMFDRVVLRALWSMTFASKQKKQILSALSFKFDFK